MKTQEEVNDIVRACANTIVAVVNSPNFVMTQEHKEWYLNQSWQIINKYIRENNGTTTKED